MGILQQKFERRITMSPFRPFSGRFQYPLVFFFILFVFGLSFRTCHAMDIRIAASEYKPYNYEVDGHITGISAEVVRAVLKQAGIDARIRIYPWPRAYKMALEGPNTLIFPIARLDQREALFKWVGTVSPAHTYFYKLRTRTDIRMTALKDARNYRVGCVREDFTLKYLTREKIPIHIVNYKEELNIRMLVSGRLDLIPFTEPAFIQRVKEIGLEPDQFEKVYYLKAISQDFYMAFSGDTDQSIIALFRQALTTVKSNGTYQSILDRYLKTDG